ncbi:MAG: hypothetical protein ACREP2_00205, partial [Rhodanobacteraceae bacterium]
MNEATSPAPATAKAAKRSAWRAWLPWVLLAIAVIATAVVYWPGVTGGWVFDDFPNIVDNRAIHITPGNSTLVAWIDSAISSPASFLHRPLASLTFSVNWYFGGGNPWPFKVTNIVIHLINGVLLYCMLRALLRLMALRSSIPPRLRRADPASVGAAEAATGAAHVPAADKSGLPALLHVPWKRRESVGAAEAATGAASVPATNQSGLPALLHLPSKRRESAGNGLPFIDDAAAKRLALLVSVAWLLLPINLMAVLYVVQRMESLCQVFVLAGLWAYLHGRWMMLTADDTRHDRRGFALASAGIVFGTLLGLTSKETAVLLPLFAFLAEAVLLRFRRGGAVASPRAARNPAAVGAAEAAIDASGAATVSGLPARTASGLPALLHGRQTDGDSSFGDKRLWTLFTVTLFVPAVLGFLWLLKAALSPVSWSGRDFTLGQRLLTEPRVLVDYLHWTIAPNPDVLSLYHDEIVKSTGILAPWTTLGAMLLLAALIAIAVLLRNRRPLVSLGIGWFFAAQLLTATIVPLELVYEQRMYFASIGVLLALGALVLGLRWRIRWPLLRGFVVFVALLWFALSTNLRAKQWSNPIRLAVAEANRHPESPRAVYEAGRQLLIASNYRQGSILTASWKYLREAAAIPGSSALADQAMIMITDHQHHGDDRAYWTQMTRKLRDQPTRQEDISALISLTNCYGAGICKFDVANLQRAYQAALSRPHPIARIDGAYADFQR